MNKLNVSVGLLLLTGLLGCRQGVNPSGPMAPMNLLTPQMRVPPPSTGSYSIPGGYYQGQASTSAPRNNFASSGNPKSDIPTTRNAAGQMVSSNSSKDGAVGSGLAQTASSPSLSPAPTPAWTDYSPRYSTIQPASYSSAASQPPSSNLAPVPTINGTFGPTTSATDAGLRPQLRGMDVVDLTRSDKPASEPTPDSGDSFPVASPATNATHSSGDLQPATRTDSASLPWRNPLQ